MPARSSTLRAEARSLLAGISRVFVRPASSLFGLFRQIPGQVVERAFTRGNRRLERRVERIEGRHEQVVKTLEGFRRRHDKKMHHLEEAIPNQLQPVRAQISSIAGTLRQLADAIERDSHLSRSALDTLRREHGVKVDALGQATRKTILPLTSCIDSLATDVLKLDARFDSIERAVSKAIQPLTARLDLLVVEMTDLTSRNEQSRDAMRDELQAVRQQHDLLQRQLTTALERPSMTLSAADDVYGTPPALRPIPGWGSAWGEETDIDPFIEGRRRLWSSLAHPVLLRWFDDLRVMIWPDNESSRTLFLTGTFEPNELTWVSHVLKKGMTLVDVGANMGIYTMFASRLVGESGAVLAVEPSPRDFQRLAFHVTLNDLQNVRCLQVAASDNPGQARLNIAWDRNSGHNTFGALSYTGVERVAEEIVQTRPLDALVVEQELARVDVIKIDVEGHEARVLAGATETLARFRPKILIEVFAKALRGQGTSPSALVAFLEGHGYALHEFSAATGELAPLVRAIDDESRNFVALPR